jgi:hypothetical protein
MTALATNRKLATVLIGAAIGTTMLAPGVSASGGPPGYPGPQPSPSSAAEANQHVPPPPSRMAASASSAYEKLRSPDSPDAREAANQPSSPSGFDWPSAAIGAAAGTGLAMLILASVGRRRAVATS